MIPLNTSVTQTGNDVLSHLDVAKINCAYSCEAYGGHCGGNLKVRDEPVEIARSGPSNCRWSLHAHGVVEDEDHQQYGLQIRIIKVIVGSKLYLAANRKFYQALCLSICPSIINEIVLHQDILQSSTTLNRPLSKSAKSFKAISRVLK